MTYNTILYEVEGEDAATEGGYAKDTSEEYKKKQAELITRHLAKSDVAITTALIPGRKAPIRITADQLPDFPSGLQVWEGGDFVLANEHIAMVIEDVGQSELYDPWGGRPVGGQDRSGLLVEGIGHPGGQPGAGLHDHFVTVGHQVGYRIGGAGHPPFAARPLRYNCDAHASPASGVLPRDPATSSTCPKLPL